jgi:hypothetical protein
VSAPAIVVRVELEEPLRVLASWPREDDELRMGVWLADHPAQAALVRWAIELAAEEQAR